MTLELDTMRPDDWPAVRAIYETGIATGDATFETAAPDWPAWDAAHLAEHRLVARIDGRVAGWTALAPVWSGSGSALAGCTAAGATWCCWSAAARPSPDATRRGGHDPGPGETRPGLAPQPG